MDFVRALTRRCFAMFRAPGLDAELDEELRTHLDLAIEENLRNGMSGREARTAAMRDLGGVTQTKENYRVVRGLPGLELAGRDARFALRQLARSPGFAAAAIATLALGIGANTAIFSVVQSVLLAPLPYFEPQHLVLLQESRPNLEHLDISYPDFQDWQRDGKSFDRIAAVAWRDFDLTAPGAAQHLAGMEVTSGFFATLGVKLSAGREFTPEEDRINGAPAALISDALWKARFAGSPTAVGKTLILDGVATPVVGILPPGFRFWTDADIYFPLAQGLLPAFANDRTVHGIAGIGRLKAGVSVSNAGSELGSVQARLDELYPAADRTLGVTITPLKAAFVGDTGTSNVQGTLLLILGAVSVVLLIACTNVASLLLARSAARAREFAIRRALGASRGRILQQLLTESMLLALAAGLAGIGLAGAGVRVLPRLLGDSLPRAEEIGMHLPVLLYALAVSLAAGVLFGLAPAWTSSGVPLQGSLKVGERGTTQVRHGGQSALVVMQIALTLVLLVGSGLLLRTIRQLWSVNPGFDTHHLIGFKVGLAPALTRTPDSTRSAFRQLIARVKAIPGVEAADLTNLMPLSDADNSGPFWLGATPPASPQDAPHALYFWTGPDYLRTMGIPLLRGRFFSAGDTPKSEHVVVVDEVLARAFFPHGDALGQTITVAHWGAARVVGVVGHVKQWGLNDPGTYNPSQIYICAYQLDDRMVSVFPGYLSFVVRTPLDAATLMPAVRDAVAVSGEDQPVYDVRTIEQLATASMAPQRLPMIMLAAFAALALVLASVGIYGTLSYSVARRVREIGIRMALGAKTADVMRMVVAQGLRLAVFGVLAGTAAALTLTRMLRSFSGLLYGVSVNDPLTFVAVSLLLLSAALLACLLPARKAMRVEPMQALRAE